MQTEVSTGVCSANNLFLAWNESCFVESYSPLLDTNQNNFFRQIRNFNLDLTAMPFTAGAGIHWQVAQATSLQNIKFEMRTDGGTENAQQVRTC